MITCAERTRVLDRRENLATPEMSSSNYYPSRRKVGALMLLGVTANHTNAFFVPRHCLSPTSSVFAPVPLAQPDPRFGSGVERVDRRHHYRARNVKRALPVGQGRVTSRAYNNDNSGEDVESLLTEASQEQLSILRAIETYEGWGLSYADLSPNDDSTAVGRAFLATNLGYAVVGLLLTIKGDLLLGGLTEVAGIVSYWYHFRQLRYGRDQPKLVKLALFVDYLTAGSALLTGVIYMVQMSLSLGYEVAFATLENVLASAAASLVCLGLCWVWEFGIPYIFLHSLWHIFSAYTAYLLGQSHLTFESIM